MSAVYAVCALGKGQLDLNWIALVVVGYAAERMELFPESGEAELEIAERAVGLRIHLVGARVRIPESAELD
jgi:hypothetical protein